MKFLYHLVLTVLLLASLAAGTVAAVWHWAPERVEELDLMIVQRYEQQPEDEVSQLQFLAEDTPAEAIPGIRALVKELEPFQRSDRRFEQRLAANRLLVTTLVKTGEVEEGLAVARQLAGFNPFDHSTRRWVASQFLQADEPHFQEGIAMLAELFETFPEDPALARTLTLELNGTGDEARAVDVVLAHLEAIPNEAKSFEQMNRPWLYSATALKRELAKTSSGSLEPLRGLSHIIFAAIVPVDVRFLRLTAPIKPQAAFGQPIVSIAFNRNMEHVGPLIDLPTDVRNATLDRQGLVLDGHLRPTITIALPEPPLAEESSEDDEAEILPGSEFRLVRVGLPINRFPRWIENFLVSESAAPKVAAIKANATESLRTQFFAERVSITRAYGIAVRGPSFHVEGRDSTIIPSVVRDTRYSADAPGSESPYDLAFEGEVTLESEAETLDIEVPAVVGAVVQLIRAEWADPSKANTSETDSGETDSGEIGATAAGVAVVDPLQLVAVEGQINTWRVLPGATNPRLRVARPQAAGLTCQVKGGIQ